MIQYGAIVTLLATPFITSHGPPSRGRRFGSLVGGFSLNLTRKPMQSPAEHREPLLSFAHLQLCLVVCKQKQICRESVTLRITIPLALTP